MMRNSNLNESSFFIFIETAVPPGNIPIVIVSDSIFEGSLKSGIFQLTNIRILVINCSIKSIDIDINT
jgi:hypothetical protein